MLACYLICRGIDVCDYAALDDQRQLVLFSGIIDEAAGRVDLTPGSTRSGA